MKKFVAFSVAALLLAACGESTAPTSSSVSTPIPTFAPRLDFTAASIGFSTDFEGDFGTSASPFLPNRIETIPANNYSRGGKKFLGRFANDVVTFTVDYTAGANVSYDLYIIGTWDGIANNKKYAPDTWQAAAFCGSSTSPSYTFTTTFSNKTTTKQNYPAQWGGTAYAGTTGAIYTGDVLGFGAAGLTLVTNSTVSSYGTVYSRSDPFPTCPGGTATVTWVFWRPSQHLQSVFDESWGLDNFSVTGAV